MAAPDRIGHIVYVEIAMRIHGDTVRLRGTRGATEAAFDKREAAGVKEDQPPARLRDRPAISDTSRGRRSLGHAPAGEEVTRLSLADESPG